MKDKSYISVRGLAKILGIKAKTLRRKIKFGAIPSKYLETLPATNKINGIAIDIEYLEKSLPHLKAHWQEYRGITVKNPDAALIPIKTISKLLDIDRKTVANYIEKGVLKAVDVSIPGSKRRNLKIEKGSLIKAFPILKDHL